MTLILVVVLLLAGTDSREGGGIHLVAALLLFPFAGVLLLAILVSPFIYGVGGWLFWRRLRDGKFPAPADRVAQWLRSRRPFGYRVRVERVKPQQPTSSA